MVRTAALSAGETACRSPFEAGGARDPPQPWNPRAGQRSRSKCRLAKTNERRAARRTASRLARSRHLLSAIRRSQASNGRSDRNGKVRPAILSCLARAHSIVWAHFPVSIPSGHSRLGCAVSRSTSAAIVPDRRSAARSPSAHWFWRRRHFDETLPRSRIPRLRWITRSAASKRRSQLSRQLKEPLVLTMLEGLSHKEAVLCWGSTRRPSRLGSIAQAAIGFDAGPGRFGDISGTT